MSIGHQIIDEIGKQSMFVVAHPDPSASHIFVWSSGAAEQLEALVSHHMSLRPDPNRKAKLEKLAKAALALNQIVEGPPSKRWAADGSRFKDTPEWAHFYVVLNDLSS